MQSMTRGLLAALLLVPCPAPEGVALAGSAMHDWPSRSDTVHVTPPTGERTTDRASIVAALERVQPGGTVLFAPGTYLIGGSIEVRVSRITLLGHADGTTLRGCDPAELSRDGTAGNRCNGLVLTGGHQTIRNLTFEYMSPATVQILRAPRRGQQPRAPSIEGGHVIEGNTFRNSDSFEVTSESPVPIVIRNNRFINTYHAVSIAGRNVHVLNNDISAPEPERVPYGRPDIAIGAAHFDNTDPPCAANVIEGNRIDGHSDGIALGVFRGTGCRGNVIRNNTIAVRRVTMLPQERAMMGQEGDSIAVGVPLQLLNYRGACRVGLVKGPMAALCAQGDSGTDGVLADNVIEGNRIVAAEGIGVVMLHASRNRVVNNTITGVARWDRFPEGVLRYAPEQRGANGTAIWVSPGSEGNQITGNTFEALAGHAVVLEGDSNVVETRSASDSVLDSGRDNRVSVAGRASRIDTLETARLIFHAALLPVGEESYTVTREADELLLRAEYVRGDRGRTSGGSAVLRIGSDQSPRAFRLRATVDGEVAETVVEVNDGRATVATPSGSEQITARDRFFTLSGFAPHAVHMMLVRYWMKTGRPDSIPILPRGHATIRHMGRDTVATSGAAVVLDRYHVSGTWWGGETLWLDDDGRLMAAVTFTFGYQAVREGLENRVAWFSERARRDALARAGATSRALSPLHTGLFALVGCVLIDGTGAPPLPDAVVLVRDGRIAAAGPRASVAIPQDAAVVDVSGRPVLPGLWDMHGHMGAGTDWGPIYLAAGVTTIRDPAGDPEWQLALREAFAPGRIAGPRALLAAIVESTAPNAVTPNQANTPEEARALVRRFHELGFEQIKVYNELRPELVPVITDEAHRLGMTVTGHLAAGMNHIDLVEAGVDQINHIDRSLVTRVVFSSRPPDPARAFLEIDLGSTEVRRLVETFLRHGTVVDPTLARSENRSRLASMPLHEMEPGAARLPPHIASWAEPRNRGVPADQAEAAQAEFRKYLEVLGMLHRAGVPIVPGTDDAPVPGHSLHRELELYVEAGMTPLEAIQSATVVSARAMRLQGDVGTIEAGKRADLIVVEGDPLRSIREIRNLRAVIANGRMYDTAALWRSVGWTP